MSLKDLAPDGPFVVEVRFSLTDGEREAEASFDCPVGHIPRYEDIVELANRGLSAVRGQIGPDFRLMTREEFVQAQLSAQTGTSMRFAVPTGGFTKEWPV